MTTTILTEEIANPSIISLVRSGIARPNIVVIILSKKPIIRGTFGKPALAIYDLNEVIEPS